MGRSSTAKKITKPTEVRFGDLIGLGLDSFRLATGCVDGPRHAADGRDQAQTPSSRAAPTVHGEARDPDAAPAVGGLVRPLTYLGLLLQAPLLALWRSVVVAGAMTWRSSLVPARPREPSGSGSRPGVFGLLLDPGPAARASHSPGDPGFWLTRMPDPGRPVRRRGACWPRSSRSRWADLKGSGLSRRWAS